MALGQDKEGTLKIGEQSQAEMKRGGGAGDIAAERFRKQDIGIREELARWSAGPLVHHQCVNGIA